MAATLKQIAALAGVSIGTVDRALKNRGRVAPSVQQRVLEIAQALDYTPNAAAKSLAMRRGACRIAFLSHIQHNDYHQALLEGVRQAAEAFRHFGVEIVLREAADFSVSDQLRQLDRLLEEGISALAVTPLNDPAIAEKLHAFARAGIPVVFVNSTLDQTPHLCYIGRNVTRQGQLITDLTALSGASRLLLCMPPLRILSHQQLLQTIRDSLQRNYPYIHIAAVVELENSNDANERLCRAALARNPDVDAVYFGSAMLEGCLTALQQSGCHPRVLTGTDSLVAREALSSGVVDAIVRHDAPSMSYRAIELLYRYVALRQTPGSDTVHAEEQILLRHSLD